jgi:DNA replication protein DnaC
MATMIEIQPEIPKIGCEKCDGFGNIITPQGVRPCECKIRAVTANRLSAAEIPPMYARKSFDSFVARDKNQKINFDRCKKYVDDYKQGNPGLLFMGGCGTGKTHLAISILRALIEKEYSGLFYNVISLLDDLRSTYALDNTATQWPIMERICKTDVFGPG